MVSISLTWRFYIHFQLTVFSNDKPNKDVTTSKADETKTLQLDDAEGNIEQEQVPEFLEWDEELKISQQMNNLLTVNLKQALNRYFFVVK